MLTHTEISGKAIPRRFRGRPIPREGEDGMFSEGWYPVCMSEDVPAGKVLGVPFLDGRVVVFRGLDQQVRVFSAYCMHLGADLAIGDATGSGIRCKFHGWEYDGEGRCVNLPSGDPVPPRVQLYRFQLREKFGIIFVHNGVEPRFELPEFPYPESQMIVRSTSWPDPFPVDPWVISANTPDLLHITALHGFEVINDPYDAVTWDDYAASFPVHARLPTGQDFDIEASIHGTNLFFQTGTMDGRWFGWAAPLGIPSPGASQLFTIVSAVPEPGESLEETNKFLDYVIDIEMSIAKQDLPIFAGMHYVPGRLTKGDRVLARFFEYVRNFPRAHPSADFIN